MPQGPPIVSIDVSNFAIVTYEVPAERVELHLPSAYELDIFHGPRGRTAFVSTTLFCNEGFRPAGLGYPRHTFNESTYRTYVTHKGRGGIYFFGRFLGTRRSWLAQRTITRDVYPADFQTIARKDEGGYAAYECRITASEGTTSFALEARDQPVAKPPFTSAHELTQFITYRLHGFYTSSTGLQGHMPVQHPRMAPIAGMLREARFDLWTELGIVREDELSDPSSVLVVPEVPFQLFAPRFLV